MYIWTNNKEEPFTKTTIKELINKYSILVEEYHSTLKLYLVGSAEHENLKVHLDIYEIILSDLKRLRI